MKDKVGVDTIIILIAIVITAIFLVIALVNKGEYIEDGVVQQSGLSQVIQQANDPELQKFNAKIEGFGGNQNGQTVKGLLTAIETSNKNNDKKITVTGGENIDESAKYEVSFTKDGSGYINSAKIEKK